MSQTNNCRINVSRLPAIGSMLLVLMAITVVGQSVIAQEAEGPGAFIVTSGGYGTTSDDALDDAESNAQSEIDAIIAQHGQPDEIVQTFAVAENVSTFVYMAMVEYELKYNPTMVLMSPTIDIVVYQETGGVVISYEPGMSLEMEATFTDGIIELGDGSTIEYQGSGVWWLIEEEYGTTTLQEPF